MRQQPDLPRRIGFWGASAVMVGVIIGSGIFQTPPDIARHLGSPLLVLMFWALGGLLSLFGALTFSELACMHPQSGGVYVFLREGFGRATAFVFGWTYLLITKPFAAAGIAWIFAEHLNTLLGAAWDPRIVSAVMLTALTGINAIGVNAGTGLAKVLTSLKIGALMAIVFLAFALAKGASSNLRPEPAAIPLWMALAPVMAGVLWTYDGWADIGSIAGEVRDPQRQLPRIYLIGTAFVTALYLAVNAAYMWMMPLSEIRASQTIAPAVMERLVGPAGAVAVTLIIVVSTLGASHSSVLTGARVTYAQARDGLLFSFLARVHPRHQTPAVALWAQLALSIAALLTSGSFRDLAGGFVFTMWIFYGLAACSIFILRIRRPDAERPYRCWGYPVVPALFILAAAAMTALSIITDLKDPESKGIKTLPWLGLLIAGLPIYSVWQALKRRADRRREREAPPDPRP